jgi:hypothetical protein
MKELNNRKNIFWVVVLVCIFVATGYTLFAFQRQQVIVNAEAVTLDAPTHIALPEELANLQNQPYVLVINRQAPYIGQVQLVNTNSTAPETAQTAMACDRVHFSSGKGVCLLRDTTGEGNHVIVTLFDSKFQAQHTLAIDGSPSRARVSPDGRYAAFTVFVTGHSYNDPNLSVATIILDTTTGMSLGNLEEFETWKDGKLFQAIEFNFWGVTFAQDSNLFYATLRYGDTTYLVQGDIAARTMNVLRENVECPSLSPDGKRIAFKKRMPDSKWRLTVLDLATMREIPLAEEQSIDDQVEWFDNQHILYENIDPNPPPWMSIFMIPADGSGTPVVYVSNAVSPVFVP